MSRPIIISECKEPWIYWWLWLPYPTKKTMIRLYLFMAPKGFKGIDFTPSIEERKTIWEREGQPLLSDNNWLQLAQTALIYEEELSDKDKQEIWRQVYRIASARI